jgi:hypothetical protein
MTTVVIPGRPKDEPGIITTIGSMDSGPAPKGRIPECRQAYANTP